jgi:hypothetical protein
MSADLLRQQAVLAAALNQIMGLRPGLAATCFFAPQAENEHITSV